MIARPPLYGLRVAATGLALAATGLALLLWMFRATLGPFAFFTEIDVPGPLRAALWLAEDAVDSHAAFERWQVRLGPDAELTAFQAGATVSPARVDLIIWDGAVVDPDAVTHLGRFVRAGGSAALLGIREAEGDGSAAFAALAELWGSVPLRRDAARLWRLEPGAAGPLRAGLPLLAALPLRRADPLYSLDDPRTELRWGRSAASGPTPVPGAAWRAQVGAGRIAWLGARPDHALDRSEAQIAMDSLVGALVAWLVRTPFAELVAADPELRPRLAGVRARLTAAGPHRFLLALSQRGASATPDFEVRVHLNRDVDAVEVSATTASGAAPAYRLRPGSRQLDLQLPGLAPSESRLYHLDLLQGATQRARRGS